MSDAIEQRLAAAARAAREHDLCGQQHAAATERERAAAQGLDAARREYAGEEKDLAVGSQIRDAQNNADRSVQQVRALQDRFKEQIAAVTERLNAMDAQRQQLLTQ